ncbi:zinc ribbon domain-containing protein [Pseudolysinimonas sp.]|uniref:zinc ribbon domain-containing protein n=1 Tax=Pseudolysinimonas sp. TaxID=2680009 RepID=UPI003F81DEF1
MPLKAAPEYQALLLELQALDTRLGQLAHRAARLPEIAALQELTGRRDDMQAIVRDRTGAWEDAKAELARTESDVAVVEARVARDRERLQSSSSPKDIAALEQELAALAKRRSDLEDIELEVMQTVEDRAAELETSRAALAALDASIVDAQAARDAALSAIATDREHAEADRGTVAARIPADLLALYEKQRARYGVGASHLERGMSSATGVMLGASDLGRVRAAAPDDVIVEEESGAILVRTAESGL